MAEYLAVVGEGLCKDVGPCDAREAANQPAGSEPLPSVRCLQNGGHISQLCSLYSCSQVFPEPWANDLIHIP